MGTHVSKGLLSVVTGNTPTVRGKVVDTLLGLLSAAVVLAVSIHGRGEGYPSVQRFLRGDDPCLEPIAPGLPSGARP
ncbi:hypothetical protein ACFXPY_45725 [Streptomyces sp. NPDC059153]|uniref:hypothetical protein n=1 Tax=Streptomyces sp. NPDC059153 TaxID=3346743 RepID=UPI00368CA2DA